MPVGARLAVIERRPRGGADSAAAAVSAPPPAAAAQSPPTRPRPRPRSAARRSASSRIAVPASSGRADRRGGETLLAGGDARWRRNTGSISPACNGTGIGGRVTNATWSATWNRCSSRSRRGGARPPRRCSPAVAHRRPTGSVGRFQAADLPATRGRCSRAVHAPSQADRRAHGLLEDPCAARRHGRRGRHDARGSPARSA